jgi:catechol 2,3-dioxygenase-like lactoylglutathione lyase family enzyme
MKVMPIRYTTDVAACARFYGALGLDVDTVSRPGAWAELPAAGGMLALHKAGGEDVGSCELAFESDEPLEAVVERLTAAGYPPSQSIVDESFGRSVRIQDPDGVWVQVNENDRELYT